MTTNPNNPTDADGNPLFKEVDEKLKPQGVPNYSKNGFPDPENPFDWIEFRRKKYKYFVVEYGRPRFQELDSYAIMWNGHFVNYFENARQQLGRFTDLNSRLLEEYGYQIPIHSYHVKMRKPVEANDDMRVAVRPVSFKSGLVDFEHLMLVNGEVHATGTTIHAVLDMKERQIVYPFPDIVWEIVTRVFKPFEDDGIVLKR